MDIWLHVAEFAIKTGLVVLAVGILAILISSLVPKAKPLAKPFKSTTLTASCSNLNTH